jgi:uncharacterized protein YjbI with pentapeptide repeats
MANAEHLEILKEGVEAWKQWRAKNKDTRPDLSGADLSGADLRGSDLGHADLRQAILMKANLMWADLMGTNLTGANLNHANLREATLLRAKLGQADLSWANLNGADLSTAILIDADLRDARLGEVNLLGADCEGADFGRADLMAANFSAANLSGTKLNAACLYSTNLNTASLTGADLSEARCWATAFTNVDLDEVKGLESVIHRGPSSIGIDTIYKSQGQIPDKFLRDAGVPEEIIDIARSIRNGPPSQWHSCFISYSTKNEEFARRLHSRMKEANMRVWFAPEDIEGGKKLHEQLFSAIQINDKLLLVLSLHSIQSEWVMTEIRKAREVEKKENRRKLFPIRLVDFETLRAWTCFDADTGKDLAAEVREYFIPDFSNWKDHDAFEAAFGRLREDLKVGTPKADSKKGA